MSGHNGSKTAQQKILQKFQHSYNILQLYDFAYRKFNKKVPGIHHKYASLFSYIHLMNTRSVQQDKQQQFIREWKKIVQHRQKVNFTAHLQELIKLMEIIDDRVKQARMFVQFLSDITQNKWERLESAMLDELIGFRNKIEQILRGMLNKQAKINGELKKRLKFIMDLAVDTAKVNTQPSEAIHKENAHQAINFRQPQLRKNNEQNSAYKVASMKLCIKQKPQAVKLLTNEEVQTLRKEIAERMKSSTITAEASVKGSDKATSFKIKSQNYNTYHTEISEDSEQCSSHQQGNINSKLLQKKSGKISLPRHHRSNFQDASKLKKLLDPKEHNPKFNSIHKIQGINGNQKPNRNIDDIPSRFTIEDSSMNRFVSSDIHTSTIDSGKKQRVGKVSILGRLDRTIKKIQIKNIKRPRGGMFFPDEKLKEINEIYKDVRQDQSSNEEQSSPTHHSARNSSSTNSEQAGGAERDSDKMSALDNKRISELIESYSHKQQSKYKRRFGVSSKKLNSNKSIDWSSQQAKNAAKNKISDVSRTSIFRSSGSNLEEKRSVPKSKYNHYDSHKKFKHNKSQLQFYEERDSNQLEDIAKKWALSKKSNQKLVTDQNIFNIDRQAVVSQLDKFKALNSIHDQEKLDRSSKYEEYYDEILRRKYEGGTRDWNRQDYDQAPTFFKIDNYTDKTSTKARTSNKQGLLFDLMLSNIKTIQTLQLQQMGVQSADQ